MYELIYIIQCNVKNRVPTIHDVLSCHTCFFFNIGGSSTLSIHVYCISSEFNIYLGILTTKNHHCSKRCVGADSTKLEPMLIFKGVKSKKNEIRIYTRCL